MAVLQEMLNQYGQNTAILRARFKWHDATQIRAAAFALALKGIEVDAAGAQTALDLIKTKTGMLSPFRGRVAQLPMACLLSAYEDSEGALQRSMEVYDALRGRRFWASEHLAHAALLVSLKNTGQDSASHAETARIILDELKTMHPLLTTSDRYIQVILLAQNPHDPRDSAHAVERIYENARPAFSWKSGAYTTAQALAALDKPDAVYSIFDISEELKRRGYNAQWHSAPASLALLALLALILQEDPREIAENVSAIAQTLKGIRELGPAWSIAKSELIMTGAAFAVAEKIDISAPVSAASLVCPYDIIYSQAVGYLIMLAQSSAGA
ncbi:MAG: DUF4003 family protein [Christensenellales bacterium]